MDPATIATVLTVAGEAEPYVVGIVKWIAAQVQAAKEGAEAQRLAALESLAALHSQVVGVRAAEQADHDAAVAGQ